MEDPPGPNDVFQRMRALEVIQEDLQQQSDRIPRLLLALREAVGQTEVDISEGSPLGRALSAAEDRCRWLDDSIGILQEGGMDSFTFAVRQAERHELALAVDNLLANITDVLRHSDAVDPLILNLGEVLYAQPPLNMRSRNSPVRVAYRALQEGVSGVGGEVAELRRWDIRDLRRFINRYRGAHGTFHGRRLRREYEHAEQKARSKERKRKRRQASATATSSSKKRDKSPDSSEPTPSVRKRPRKDDDGSGPPGRALAV